MYMNMIKYIYIYIYTVSVVRKSATLSLFQNSWRVPAVDKKVTFRNVPSWLLNFFQPGNLHEQMVFGWLGY